MESVIEDTPSQQELRNRHMLSDTPYCGGDIESRVLPLSLDPKTQTELDSSTLVLLEALGIEAARTAIRAVSELSKHGEVDHLGGGLELIGPLLLTLAMQGDEAVDYTIEHAHTSIGYYGALASLGYLDPEDVVARFRQSLDIAGHVSWVPGGTPLGGGRLGVMIPAAVGCVLGNRARFGDRAWEICHCGDAGWISGQGLNGFNAAAVHQAPITFVMHRNGIQLSGPTAKIMDLDPRPVVESLGVRILEVTSLHDTAALFAAYREARQLAGEGVPSLIYPMGTRSRLETLGETLGISEPLADFAARHGVGLDTEVAVPGSLMSHRDVTSMLECIFLVNGLPGGKSHHDGHMNGRDLESVLANPMLALTDAHKDALTALRSEPPQIRQTLQRSSPGTANLVLEASQAEAVSLPDAGAVTSPRAGVQAGYEAVAKAFSDDVFMIDCDLAPSTKIDKARGVLAEDHQFELGIEELAASVIANGLAMSTRDPQLVVFATFAAFFEGIAREGMEMWRYQRNLNGVNEGLNVTYHLSHVGSCTGRDHFAGWSLDWINLAIGYLPYLHRFYAPADARSAFLAVKDLAAHQGGHIIGIPRASLPVLQRQDSEEPLWQAGDDWTPTTTYRRHPGAKKAILVMGAPTSMAGEAADELAAAGVPVDVHILNGLPVPASVIEQYADHYSGGLVTVEDGLIGTGESGLRGLAGYVLGMVSSRRIPLRHIGIEDPRIAPSHGHHEVWEHFGITRAALVDAVHALDDETTS